MWYSGLYKYDNCSGMALFLEMADGELKTEVKEKIVPRFKNAQGDVYTYTHYGQHNPLWECVIIEKGNTTPTYIWRTTDMRASVEVINIKDGKVLLRGDFVLIVSKDWAHPFRSGSKMLGRLEKEDVENLTVNEVRELARDYGYSAIMY